jgi:hypothetical protein
MFTVWLVGVEQLGVGAHLVECDIRAAAMVRCHVVRRLLARYVGWTTIANPKCKAKAMYLDSLHYVPL